MDSHEKDFLSVSSDSYHFLDDDELEYMSLIQDQIQPFFPHFSEALLKQSPYHRERGRCAVVEYDPQTRPQIITMGGSVDLQRYMVESSTGQKIATRRLFILEDLPCNYILTLGSRLRIPPSFFAGHFDDPTSHTFNHRSPFSRTSRSRFRLRYATSARFELDVPPADVSSAYAFDTNVCRYVHMYKPTSPYDDPRSYHTLSYWSSPVAEDGSWDSVLLVDPPLGESVRCLSSGRIIAVRWKPSNENAVLKHFLHPELEVVHKMPEHPWQWAEAYMRLSYASMFDDTLQILAASKSIEITNPVEPFQSTDIPRKLVISTLIAYLRRRHLSLLSLQKNRLRLNYMYNFAEGSFSCWHDELFDFIIGVCAAMKELSREIEENMVDLGLPTSPNDSIPGIRTVPQWELDGWLAIRNLTHALTELTNSFATIYQQYTSIQEARVANGNAHNLSRITMLTMFFTPLSTVAAIFSMGDEFRPGSRDAWVFWVVSIPILGVLAYLYWHQRLVGLWVKKRRANDSAV